MSTSRVASATSLAPHALKNSLPPPKVPVPKLSTGTLNPDPPSCRYSMKEDSRDAERSIQPKGPSGGAGGLLQAGIVGVAFGPRCVEGRGVRRVQRRIGRV